MELTEAFWSKVVMTDDECWLWTGRTLKGYGIQAGKLAHRKSYEALIGPIPQDLQIDHLCRNTLCVRPDHLEAVSREENVRRAWADKTHCPNGHLYTPETVYIRPSGHKKCRPCTNARQHEYQARKRAAA